MSLLPPGGGGGSVFLEFSKKDADTPPLAPPFMARGRAPVEGRRPTVCPRAESFGGARGKVVVNPTSPRLQF